MTAAKPASTATPAEESVGQVDPSQVNAQSVPDSTPPSRGQSFLFSIGLTVLAVLPIAIGIGAARAKAQVIAQSQEAEVEHAKDAAPRQVDFKDRAIGDRDFHERRYETALRYYESIGGEPADRLPPEILYRVALCHEGLGRWDAALEAYRVITRVSDSPILIAASKFGQARVHLKLGELHAAIDQLRAIELHCDPFTQLPRSLRRDLAFLIPITMAFDVFEGASDEDRSHNARLGELVDWSLEGALAWVDDFDQTGLGQVDATAPVNALSCKRILPAGLRETPKATSSERVEACFKQQSVKSVIDCAAQSCGWTVDWTDLDRAASIGGKIDFEWDDCPLSTLLTSCASEIQATWRLEGEQLVIQHADPERRHLRGMLISTLSDLTNWISNHRLVDHAVYAKARMLELSADPEAMTLYSSVVRHDASPLAIQAAYRAAKICCQQKNDARACFYLGVVVNGAPGHVLHTESLILLGRLLLDGGQPQEAAFQLRRATESHAQPLLQTRAAVLLGVAYLAQDKLTEAAQVIFEHRQHFEDQEAKTVASFVNSFARWQVVTGELRKREAGFLYRSLVATNVNADWIGQMTKVMIGRAFAELGFDDKMTQLYWQMAFEGVTPQIEPEILYSLANYEFTHENAEGAVLKWAKLAESGPAKWANRSRMRLAEIAFGEGRGEDCLNYCEKIKDFQGIVRGDLSRLMGQTYEFLGDDAMAAKCYAGLLP